MTPGPPRAAGSPGGPGTAAALALGVLLTRLPFLGASYGTDNDAWWVVAAARHIARTREYTVLRFPGYPLHECPVALLERGGPWVVEGASALACAATLVGVLALAISRRFARPGPTTAPERTRRFFHYSPDEEGARPLLAPGGAQGGGAVQLPARAESIPGMRPAAIRSRASA